MVANPSRGWRAAQRLFVSLVPGRVADATLEVCAGSGPSIPTESPPWRFPQDFYDRPTLDVARDLIASCSSTTRPRDVPAA